MTLNEWAIYCAYTAKTTKGRDFEEPLLTEIRLGWDRVIKARKYATMNEDQLNNGR